jgi:hypothetical protein
MSISSATGFAVKKPLKAVVRQLGRLARLSVAIVNFSTRVSGGVYKWGL